MGLKEDLQSDFDVMLDDFGISTQIPGTTATVTALRNTRDLDITYSEETNKSVEYKFTLWYDVSDITAAGTTVPVIHDEILIDGINYLVARVSEQPLNALVSFDMVERYG